MEKFRALKNLKGIIETIFVKVLKLFIRTMSTLREEIWPINQPANFDG